MLFRKTFIIVFLSLTGSLSVLSQLNKSGSPLSWNPGLNISPLDNWHDLPVLNTDAFFAQDVQDGLSKDKPYRFAYPLVVNISLSSHGEWSSVHNGGRIWRLGLRSTDAYSMTVNFTDFNIPEGSYVYIYNNDRTDYLGPLGWDDNKAGIEFSMRPITGDKIVIEYYEPVENFGEGKLKIGSIAHAYRNLHSTDFGDKGCAHLLSFEEFPELKNISTSVMMMIVDNGTRASTGVLVNNTRNDGTPYLLTSVQALIGDPESWVFIANFNQDDCENDPGNCMSRALIGAEVLYTDYVSGVALLRLKDTPRKEWKTFYSGWDFDALFSGKYVSIQHGLGRMQTISTFYGLPTSDYWGKWKTLKLEGWNLGSTLPGAVGSPLFNSRGQLVSQFIGGNEKCGNSDEEFFCRVKESWSELRQYLDPIGSSSGAYIGYFAIAQAEGKEETAFDFDVFPNPASNSVYIRNNSDYAVLGVRIKDNAGRYVQYEVPSFPEIDISYLPDGVYHFIIETSNGSFARRLIKQ